LMRLGKQAGVTNAKIITFTGKIVGGVMLACGTGLAVFMIMAVYGIGLSLGT